METTIIEERTIRRVTYDIIHNGNLYWIAKLNKLGIPEFQVIMTAYRKQKLLFEQIR